MKKFLLLLLTLLTCFCFSFGLSSCKKESIDGTYYQYEWGKLKQDSYIKIDGKKWSDDDAVTGTLKKDGEKIVFYSKVFGSNEEMFDGTIKDGVLSLYVLDDDNPEIYCKEGCEPELATEGLAYELKDNKYYVVTGIGEAKDSTIYIPSEYNEKPVREIANEAFRGCKQITGITIGKNVHTVGYAAFYQCSNVTSIRIGRDVKVIQETAFSGCSATVIDVQVDKNNKTYESEGNCIIQKEKKSSGCGKKIGKTLVFGCQNSVIPDDVVIIGPYAFASCNKLISITIPHSVTKIEYGAFYGCHNLVEVINKSDLAFKAWSTNSGSNVTANYTRQVITDESESNVIEHEDYVFYNDNGTYLLMGYKGDSTELVLPEQIQGHTYQIAPQAFSCSVGSSYVVREGNSGSSGSGFIIVSSNIQSITIPDGVTSIGEKAFDACKNLVSVTIGNSVTSVGERAFLDCTNLTRVIIGNGLETIERGTFGGCTNLTSVVIPLSVRTIGYAFFECEEVKVYYMGTEEQWQEISIEEANRYELRGAAKYYYSETEPTSEGNYWRYVDGVPTVW